MSVIVRFAPSPTGHMHIGNLRQASINWLFAKKQGGKVILRFDDTDPERCREEFKGAIMEDLSWLGLTWDSVEHQSKRFDRYELAREKLVAAGRLYPCFETPDELALKRKTQLGRGLPPIYDRAALSLTEAQKQQFLSEGRKPHWRFLVEDKTVDWHDLAVGAMHFKGGDLGDPIIIREDGSYLYTLPSVVDDIEFAITHIIRGEDHLANTAVQSQIFEALGAKPPIFAHLPLLLDASGGKLSKRLGALSARALRNDIGLEPQSIISLLARLGTSEPIEAIRDVNRLIEAFSFDKFSRAQPKFDEEELYRINAKLMHEMPFADISYRLKAMELDGIDEAFWNVVRPNLAKLKDIADWWQMARGDVLPIVEDAVYIRDALAALPPKSDWNEGIWQVWTNALKETTGRKGKVLFMPLRQALTGMDHGPEMPVLLLLIGYDRTVERLQSAAKANAA